MTLSKLKWVLGAMVLLAAVPVFAGAEGKGGGRWSEGDLKHFLTNLVPYIASVEGQALFPEIVQYDRDNPKETVEKILGELNPSLVNHKVFDSDHIERDCVSGKKRGVRFFQCNIESLPPKPDEKTPSGQLSEYYGSMYRLVLHEGLVQVGLEKPLFREVPSEYPISSRLNVHSEYFREWAPGAGTPVSGASTTVFTSCACEVEGYGYGLIGSLYGQTFVKMGNGSVELQKIQITRVNVANGTYTDNVLGTTRLCLYQQYIAIQQKVCPPLPPGATSMATRDGK